MSVLNDEVQMNIDDFIQTAKDLKDKTAERALQLTKIKK